jgi:hypothetical protein
MRVARDDAPVSWSAATRYAEPSASDAPFSARPSSPTFSPSSWRPSASLSWLPYNQLHWWSETPGRSPGGAAGAVPSDPARSRTDESRRCTAISGRVQQKRANVARDKAYVLGCALVRVLVRVLGSAVMRFRLGMLTIWEGMHPPPRASGAYPVRAGCTSRSRRRDNQPERVGASRRPSRLTETNFAP